MKSRISRLERLLDCDRPPPCPACAGLPKVQYLDQFVDENGQEYFLANRSDSPPRGPCPACGEGPFRIETALYTPKILPRGRPRNEATFMTPQQARDWYLARGEPDMAQYACREPEGPT